MARNEPNPPTSADAELVVLSVLDEDTLYGYAITKKVAARSEGGFAVPPGVLYPLLARLEKDGLIASSWEEVRSERAEGDGPGRRRKWYRLTPKGRRRLAQRIEAHRGYLAMIEAFIGRVRGGSVEREEAGG
jgi:PadR family transcriptional regulator, regulatory protein PadR